MNAEPASKWQEIPLKIKGFFFDSSENRHKKMLLRKRKILHLLTQRLTILKIILIVVGYIWMLILPFPGLGETTYMDENALQPAQVNTNWDWGHVHQADMYLEQLEHIRDSNLTGAQRGTWIQNEFAKIGISSATQTYSFYTGLGVFNGTNSYAVLASPRHSGTEAMVISASWISRAGEGSNSLNLRGVATVLALAGFLKHYSYWSKDIIFVISDGHLEGMQAWLSSYHGSTQIGLQSQPLELTSGVIWTALNIDYPGHSFSHIGLFFEALNGRLPNQDLINSVQRISRYTAGIPVTLYDHLDPREESVADVALSWLPQVPEVRTYFYQARNLARHIRSQYHGRGNGVHGLFRKFRIDAITLFCIPATGPHGFHAIGRTVESTLRTMNNLIERLHASFFFYILTSPSQFLKIGLYLPSVILISVAVMIHGLSAWVDAAWIEETITMQSGKSHVEMTKWKRRKRPVIGVFSIVMATHTLGAVLFAVISSSWFIKRYETLVPIIFALFATLPLLSIAMPLRTPLDTAPTSAILKAANLCLASTVISLVTVLNFSLAASLSVFLTIPLISTSCSSDLTWRLVRYAAYAILGLGWLFAQKEVLNSIWSWQVFSVWFAPFVCVVYVPLLLQAGIVCLLPP